MMTFQKIKNADLHHNLLFLFLLIINICLASQYINFIYCYALCQYCKKFQELFLEVVPYEQSFLRGLMYTYIKIYDLNLHYFLLQLKIVVSAGFRYLMHVRYHSSPREHIKYIEPRSSSAPIETPTELFCSNRT